MGFLKTTGRWIVPVIVAGMVVIVAKGAMAEYVEGQLVLGESVNTQSITVEARKDENDREIFYIDGERQVQVTDNNYDDLLPVYSEDRIYWQAFVNNMGWQIMMYNITTGVTTQLTHSSFPSEYPHAAGGMVTWEMPRAQGSDIFFFDGLDVIRVTNNKDRDERPKTDGNYIVWEHYDGNDIEVLAYSTVDGSRMQVTNDDENQTQLAIYAGEVFYKQFDGNDNEIFGKKIVSGQIRQITDNNVDDGNSEVRGGVLVWATKLKNKGYTSKGLQLVKKTTEVVPSPSATPLSSSTPSPSPNKEDESSSSPTPIQSPSPEISIEPSISPIVSPSPSPSAPALFPSPSVVPGWIDDLLEIPTVSPNPTEVPVEE